jgi:cytochrome c5
MKNFNRVFPVAIIASVFMAFVLFPSNAYSQKKTEQQTLSAIPESVSGIFKNSCVGCHSDQSNGKAKIFMNLSSWDKLSTKKQVKTGKKINKQISKGSMPPEGFLKKKPDAALTAMQKSSVSAWAKSLKK